MEQLELEFLAIEVRKRAGVRADELPLAIDIAERILGEGSVVYGAPNVPPRLVEKQIVVPKGHPDLNFAVAHELGEWALREIAMFTGPHTVSERAANSVAAAILAPPTMLRRALTHFGEERLKSIASVFGMSQTSIVLRIAEVESLDRVVVTKNRNLLERGTLAEPDVLIEAAVKRGKAKFYGLVKTRLRGGIDEGRVALRAR